MYLSNKDIKIIIKDMNFEVFNLEFPFSEEEQIQICSIDLRLSNEFWKQKRVNFPIDLHKSKLAELSPRRHWKKIVLSKNEPIILKPNEFLLGHTNEKFTIPPKYAGKINTRSSYARMGIDTNSATDFINPGWQGYVPLEIINKSRNSLKIYPFMSIAQLILIPLSSEPEGLYGEKKLGNIYQNDDGGPSQWWRDKMFTNLQNNNQRLSDDTLQKLIEKFKNVDDLGLYRFDKFFERLKTYEIDSSENLIDKFSKKERFRSTMQNIYIYLVPLLQGALVSLSLRQIFYGKPHTWVDYTLWAFSFLWLAPTLYFLFFREKTQYYNKL